MYLAAEKSLIARDTAIPGLEMVLNPERLRSSLQQLFPEIPLGDLQPTYLRYKIGTNCLVAYRLKLKNQWLTFYVKALHQKHTTQEKTWQQRPGLVGPLGLGRQVLPSMATKLSEFPNDSKLPGLAYLTQLKDSWQDYQRLFPDSSQSGKLLQLRYKTERRYVAQWVENGQPQALVKAYAAKGFETASRNIRNLHSCDGLKLSRPLAQFRDHGLISYEWLPGKDLVSLLTESDNTRSELEAVGNALAKLHQQTLPKQDSDPNLVNIKAVSDLVDWLGFVWPDIKDLARQIGDRLVQYLHQMPRLYQAIHGDFYADQVVVMSDAIAILDLDRATQGDPMVDLGNFQAHLERQCLQGALSYAQVECMQSHLLTGYHTASEANVGPNSETRLALYTALGLFFLSPAPFRYRDPRWPELTVQLLERVLQLLEQIPAQAFRLA
ncbi:MAG: phosphotransferase family protein [Leptolyngbyaceae cyanobacterium]